MNYVGVTPRYKPHISRRDGYWIYRYPSGQYYTFYMFAHLCIHVMQVVELNKSLGRGPIVNEY